MREFRYVSPRPGAILFGRVEPRMKTTVLWKEDSNPKGAGVVHKGRSLFARIEFSTKIRSHNPRPPMGYFQFVVETSFYGHHQHQSFIVFGLGVRLTLIVKVADDYSAFFRANCRGVWRRVILSYCCSRSSSSTTNNGYKVFYGPVGKPLAWFWLWY